MPPTAIYVWRILMSGHSKPLWCRNSLVSLSVNGKRCFSWVIRLWSPPLLSIIFLIIQDVALPQTIINNSRCLHPQLFQKKSKAFIRPDFGVARHGSSSMNTTIRLPGTLLLSNNVRKDSNADIQVRGLLPQYPYSLRDVWNAVSSSFLFPSMIPVVENVYCPAYSEFTR